jgi:hypothetical protein
MSVAASPARARRKLSFDSLDEVISDAERLVESPNSKTLGAWPLGQLCTHLAMAINGSIDGIEDRAPLPVRMLGPLLKRWILARGMSPGFKLPKQREAVFFPAATSAQEGLDKLRAAACRVKTERMTAQHPAFGKLTHDEWNRLHLRHAELHLSFAVPE